MDLRMVWNKCKSASILPVNHGFKGMKLKGLRMLVNFQLFNCWDIQPYSLVLVVMFTNRIRSQGHIICAGALVAWPHKSAPNLTWLGDDSHREDQMSCIMAKRRTNGEGYRLPPWSRWPWPPWLFGLADLSQIGIDLWNLRDCAASGIPMAPQQSKIYAVRGVHS